MICRAFIPALISLFPLLPATQAIGQERQTLGWGRLFDNDALGDTRDRWHSGSYSVSMLRGREWDGQRPPGLGEILEYRISGATISSGDLTDPPPIDRRYAGLLSIGVHSHLDWQGFDTTLGADLVAIGPQTGAGNFQTWLHDLLNVGKPDLSNQLGDSLHPTFRAELGRDLALAGETTLHPFIAAEAGVETLLRVGGDLIIGSFGQDALMLRDTTTGQRYLGIRGEGSAGLSFMLGGDMARVFETALLPEGGAVTASDTRTRLRAGLNWQGESSSMFYGVTYMGPEFDEQPEGQFVGSVNLNLRF